MSVETTPATALRDVQQASLDVRQALARRLGLGINDVGALDHLVSSADPMGPVELGHRLGIRSASATALVDRLEQVGHVERTAHPDDRRRLVLRPTASAGREMRRTLRPLVSALDDAAADLSPAEVAVVIAYLQRAATAMRAFALDDQ